MSDGESVEAIVARMKAEKEAEAAPLTSVSQTVPPVRSDDEYADLGLEEVSEHAFERTPHQQAENDWMIEHAKQLPIETTWRIYVSKPWEPKGSGANILIRCPLDSHTDKKQSASYSPSKNLWTCHACAVGGSAIDLAAIGINLDLQSGKGKEFWDLIRDMLAQQGLTLPSQQVASVHPDPPSLGSVTPITQAPSLVAAGPVEPPPDHLDDQNFKYPTIDWRSFLPKNTFLWEYLNTTCALEIPDEYNFWNGMLAVGASVGRETWVAGRPSNVFANLYVCTVGATGDGKTKASRILTDLLNDQMPYDSEDPFNKGVLWIPTPGSKEHLVKRFIREIADINTPKVTRQYPVKGLISFAELSTLTAMIGAPNSGEGFKNTIMELFDGLPRTGYGSDKAGGSIYAENPFSLGTSTTQLRFIKSIMSEKMAVSGFLNRWIFAMGPRKPDTYDGDLIPWSMTDPTDAFQNMRTFWSVRPGILHYTDEGLKAAKQLYDDCIRPVKFAGEDTPEGPDDLLARIDLIAKKLMLLFATNMKSEQITPTVVDQVRALFPYLVKSYKTVGARIGISIQSDQEQKVINSIISLQTKNGGVAPTGNEINDNLGTRMAMKNLRPILDDLIALQIIEPITPIRQPGQRGQLGVRYRYAG